MNEEWLGGSMDTYGGGYKVNLLRNALEPHKDDDKLIVLFTDRWVLLELNESVYFVRRFS